MKVEIDCSLIINNLAYVSLTYPTYRDYTNEQLIDLMKKVTQDSNNFKKENGVLNGKISYTLTKASSVKKTIIFDVEEETYTQDLIKKPSDIYKKIFGFSSTKINKDGKTIMKYFVYVGMRKIPKIQIYVGTGYKKMTHFKMFGEIFMEYRKPTFRATIKNISNYSSLIVRTTFGDKKILQLEKPDTDFIYDFDIAANRETNRLETQNIIKARIKYPRTLNSDVDNQILEETCNFTICHAREYMPGFSYRVYDFNDMDVKIDINILTSTYEFYDIYIKKILKKCGIIKEYSHCIRNNIVLKVVKQNCFAPIYDEIFNSCNFNIYLDRDRKVNILTFDTMKDVYDICKGEFLLYIGE